MAEGEDLGFELGWGFARLMQRNGGMILEALGEALGLSPLEPFADGFFGDGESGSGGAQGAGAGRVMLNHFNSHERSECGISVHSDRAGWR